LKSARTAGLLAKNLVGPGTREITLGSRVADAAVLRPGIHWVQMNTTHAVLTDRLTVLR
jgi:hypothetical protein